MTFERRLGLFDCVLLSIGGMVGSAIFIFPGTTGRLVGPAAVGAWLLAGVLMVTIALCYAELSLAFPETGAPAVFPYETLGPSPLVRTFASYLEGIGYTLGWVFGLTISALAIGDYLAQLFPAAGGHTVIIALFALALAALVNVLGVDVTSRANLLLSAVLLAVLVTFVAAGMARFRPGNYEPLFTGGTLQFLAAVQIAITGYGAWTAIPAAIEEIENPARTVPRAIVLSLLVTTVLYTSIVAVIHGVVTPAQFVGGGLVTTAPLRVATEAIGLGWVRYLLAVTALVAIFTTLLVGVMSASRVLYALGERSLLPSHFGTTSERFQTPWVGVVTVTAVASALATVPQYFTQLLVVSALVGTGLPYSINILSFVGLRYYRTDVNPSFRAPGGYALAVVAFIALAIAMFGLSTTEVAWSLGVVAVLGGYFVVRVLYDDDVLTGDAPMEST